MILFSINPAFDMLPASEDIDAMFAEEFSAELKGIDPEHAALYSILQRLCRRQIRQLRRSYPCHTPHSSSGCFSSTGPPASPLRKKA